MDDLPFCGWCGVVIGAYEPMVVVEDEQARITSASKEPEPAGDCFHSECHAVVWPERHQLLLA